MVLFSFFSFRLLFSAFTVVTASNPVVRVLRLVLSFARASGLLFMIGSEFLGIIFLVVYVGAIAVVFLFVVMMLNVKWASKQSNFSHKTVLMLLLIAIGLSLFYNSTPTSRPRDLSILSISYHNILDNLRNVEMVGLVLYRHYAFPFLAAGSLLLISIVTVIALTSHKFQNVRKQDAYDQVARTYEDSMKHS